MDDFLNEKETGEYMADQSERPVEFDAWDFIEEQKSRAPQKLTTANMKMSIDASTLQAATANYVGVASNSTHNHIASTHMHVQGQLAVRPELTTRLGYGEGNPLLSTDKTGLSMKSASGDLLFQVDAVTGQVTYNEDLDEASQYFWDFVNLSSSQLINREQAQNREAEMEQRIHVLQTEAAEQQEQLQKTKRLLAKVMAELKKNYETDTHKEDDTDGTVDTI